MALIIPGSREDRVRKKYREILLMVENPIGYGDYSREEFMDLLKNEVSFLKAEIYEVNNKIDVAQRKISGYMNEFLVKAAEGKRVDIFRLLFDAVEQKDKIRFEITEDSYWYFVDHYINMLEKSIVPFYEMWLSCAGNEAAGSLVRKDILNVLSELRVDLKKSEKTVKKLCVLFQNLDSGSYEDCTELLEMRCVTMTFVLELLEKDTQEQFLSINLYKWQNVILGGLPINRIPVLLRCVRPSEIRPSPDWFNLNLIRGNRPDILKEAIKWGYITFVNVLPLYEAAADQKLCGEKTLLFLIRAYREINGGQDNTDPKDNEIKEEN